MHAAHTLLGMSLTYTPPGKCAIWLQYRCIWLQYYCIWLQYHCIGCNISVFGCNIAVFGCNITVFGCNISVLAAISLYWLQYHALAVILYVETGRSLAVWQAMREWPLAVLPTLYSLTREAIR